MEITELQAFLAVHDAGSFSEASRKIHLTQPAVSKRVAQLETRLGKPVFDRVGRHIQLTEAGRILLPHARNILDTVRETIQQIDRLEREPSGCLRMATSYHIGLHYLPPVLKSYYNEYPDVELDLNFMDSEDALEAVEDGRLELAVITLPANPDDHLETQVLWHDPLQVYCAKDHPMAKEHGIEALSRYPAILPDTHTITRQLVEHELNRHDITINVQLSSNHLESIRMMVETGLGWSVLPKTLESEFLHHYRLDTLGFNRELGLVKHRRRTLTVAAELFMERIGKPS